MLQIPTRKTTRQTSIENVRLRVRSENQMGFRRSDLENRLGENRIRPREPGSGILTDVVDIDRLVHQAKKTRVAHKIDGFNDFGIRVAAQRLHKG